MSTNNSTTTQSAFKLKLNFKKIILTIFVVAFFVLCLIFHPHYYIEPTYLLKGLLIVFLFLIILFYIILSKIKYSKVCQASSLEVKFHTDGYKYMLSFCFSLLICVIVWFSAGVATNLFATTPYTSKTIIASAYCGPISLSPFLKLEFSPNNTHQTNLRTKLPYSWCVNNKEKLFTKGTTVKLIGREWLFGKVITAIEINNDVIIKNSPSVIKINI